MSNATLSTIVSDVLVGGIYSMCAVLVVMMSLMQVRMAKLDLEARIYKREHEKVEAERARIAALEANWPQYVVQEEP